MNESRRYKLYKSGKLWLTAAIATTTVAVVGGGVVAHADTDANAGVTSAAAVVSASTDANETAAEPADTSSVAEQPAAQATVATPAAAPEPSATTSDDTGNISSTSVADQQYALSQVNAVRATTSNAATGSSATSALALNDDLNAWAQERANELTANAGSLDSTTQYSNAPEWVSADGTTSTNLQQSLDYTDGDAVYGSEIYSSMQYWNETKPTDGSKPIFQGYVPSGVTYFTGIAVNNWVNSINYDTYKYQFLTMTSPYANVMGFAYSYNATTGYTGVVVEVAYLPDIKSTETKTITRTINYTDKDSGATVADPVVQTVTYTRTKYTSQVDGSVRYSDWTSENSSFDAVDSPDLSADGYAPAADVAALATTVDTADVVVNVTYNHAPKAVTESKTVTRTVNYLDKSTGAVVSPAKTQTVTFTRTATTDSVTDTITYTDWASSDATFAAIASPDLSADGYAAADTATVPAQTVTADATNTSVNVYYDANVTSVPQTQTVTRTINYLDQATGAVVAPAQTQTVTFTRTATTNAVTNNTTYTDWTSSDATFAAVTSPDLSADGYTVADPATTTAQTVAVGDSNSTVNVYYKHATVATPETKTVTRTINYLDKATGAVISPAKTQTATFTRTATTDPVTSTTTYTDWTSSDATFAAVNAPDLSADGYAAADPATVPAQTVTADDSNISVNVYYNAGVISVPETKTVTRTIHYLDQATGATVSPAQTQTVTFTRVATTNAVTHTTTYTDWTSNDATFAAITSPDLSANGYLSANPAVVAAQTVTAGDSNSTINVYYNHATVSVVPEVQTVTRTIHYLDQTTGAVVSPTQTQTVTFTRTGTTDRVTGTTTYTNWTSNNATFAEIASPDLSGVGYTAPSAAVVAAKTVTAGDADVTVNVYYGHTTSTTTESKAITQTIKYVDAATGNELSAPAIQTVTFTRQVTTDNVTGTKTYGDWTSTGATAFTDTTSPEITGYTTATTKVDGTTVTPASQDTTITVAYDAIQPVSDNNALPTSAQPETPTSTTPVTVVQSAAPASTATTSTAQPTKISVTPTTAQPAAKKQAKTLPQTDNANEAALAGLGVTTLMTMFGFAGVMKRRQTK